MGDTTAVDRLPTCAFCSNPAVYDAKTIMGPWAYMCGQHFQAHSCQQLGTGWGQKLVLKESVR